MWCDDQRKQERKRRARGGRKRKKRNRDTEKKKKRKNQPWEKLVQQAETGWNDFKEKKYESKAT